MNEKEVLEILKSVGAIITNNHIVYTSGLHGSGYVNKDALYSNTQETSDICHTIAERFMDDNVEVVIAPAIGGVVLSQWTAYHLSTINCRKVFSVYAEKSENGDSFIIKRGYDKLITDKKILVVEDVITTGGSVQKVVKATQDIGGNVIGLGVLCNRGEIRSQFPNVPKFIALLNLPLDTWSETDCPLCKDNIPINTDIGKGREFLKRKK